MNKFVLEVPDENEAGYMGLIDAVMQVSALQEEGKQGLMFRQMKELLFKYAVEPDSEAGKQALFESLTKDEFEAAYEALTNALQAPKKS